MHSVIIDCDPGHDDAIALLVAAGSPAIEVRAVTTVAGNQTIEKVTHNALAICQIAGLDVPVARGCAGPLIRRAHVAADIHGESGLDGPTLPEVTKQLDPRHGVDLIVQEVMAANPGEITLVAIGPLTNLAMAVRREPLIVERVQQVVLMGGSAGRGNRTPAAEFNIWADPEAAAIVFSQPWSLTQVGLDVTHQATATPEVMDQLRSVTGPVGDLVVGMLDFYGSAYRKAQRKNDPPVHDPVTLVWLIDPPVMTTAPARVDVETVGQLTSGMTVTDFAHREPNAQVGTGLDHHRFWQIVVDALQTLG